MCWMDFLEVEPSVLRSGSAQSCVSAPRDSGFHQAASKMDLKHPWSVQVVCALLDGRVVKQCHVYINNHIFCANISARQS